MSDLRIAGHRVPAGSRQVIHVPVTRDLTGNVIEIPVVNAPAMLTA